MAKLHSPFRICITGLCTAGALAMAAVPPAFGGELMGDNPWSFTATNRASLAVAMKQLKDADAGTGLIAPQTFVCGGGSSAATGNSSCIILNNSTGLIEGDQDSAGDQDAVSTTDTTVTATTENNSTGVGQVISTDEILATLAGEN